MRDSEDMSSSVASRVDLSHMHCIRKGLEMVNIKSADQNMYSSAQRAFLLRLFLDYIMGTEPKNCTGNGNPT